MNIWESIKRLRWFEWAIWSSSVIVIILSFLLFKNREYLTLAASLIGVTALIFVAKGDVLGQLLTVVFALFYAVVSYRFHYWGEMITYLGMTAPIAMAAVITWLRNPFEKGEVRVREISGGIWAVLLAVAVVVTVGFYFILRFFDTPNLIVSTLSVTTSFLAASLTLLRSPYYGLFYAANDIVLIVLWILAAIEEFSYLPMVFCFVMFLVNDLYGFANWRQMSRRQSKPEMT